MIWQRPGFPQRGDLRHEPIDLGPPPLGSVELGQLQRRDLGVVAGSRREQIGQSGGEQAGGGRGIPQPVGNASLQDPVPRGLGAAGRRAVQGLRGCERLLGTLGDTKKSSAVLEDAIPLIDAEQEPRALLGAWFQLLVNLCLSDRAAEAEPGLQPVRALAERLGQELDLVRVVWLEGKVQAGLGCAGEAEAAFEQARRHFYARELDFDYAQVSLDKALLLLGQGRTAEVRALAEEMSRTFRRQRLARESLAALRVYCDAARQDAATVELTRQVVRFLHRAQHDPRLRFEAGEEAERR